MEKMKMQTTDIANENFLKLAALFPNAVTETIDENGEVVRAIDKDILMQEISTRVVEGNEERYQFTWPDKRQAMRLASTPIAATLRPCRDESVNFDTTQNLYIEGDNLDVLKLLRETYLGKVKMIYIDPPYNTGNDFVYDDDFAEDAGEFQFRDNQYDAQGNRLVQNTESNGRFHTDWLNMIYPRLKVAKDFLADDGIIFISIDEHEIVNIQKICDEVFGAGNNLGTIIWDKRNPKGEVAGVAQQHEYIVVYCKNFSEFNSANYFFRKKEHAQQMLSKAEALVKHYDLEKAGDLFKQWLKEHKNDFSGGELAYCFLDDQGQVYQPVSMAAPDKPETRSHRPLIHPVTNKPCPVPAKGWRYPDKSMDELLRKNLILFGKDENTQPRRKYLLLDNIQERVPSLLYFGGSDTTEGLLFDNPKPLYVISRLVESLGVKSEDIILDFFSGSATTANAVLKLNAEDGGKRKFIMVQLPEVCEEKSEAAKAGYKNICEIGKERIRRAGKKIKEEVGLTAANLDIGFRVLKLDSSNMEDVYYSPDKTRQDDLLSLISNIKPDRSPEDLLFQVMLELGVTLSSKIEECEISGKKVFKVADNFLIACFDENVTDEMVKAIAQEQPTYAVLRDSSFANDSVAANFEQIFATYSPDTVRRVL